MHLPVIAVCENYGLPYLGEKVDEFFKEYLDKGYYKTLLNSKNLSCGIYFCRMQSGSFTEIKKIVLLNSRYVKTYLH